MDIINLFMKAGLSFHVLTVHANDEVVRGFGADKSQGGGGNKVEIGRPPPDALPPPAAGLVTVVFLYELIDCSADGTKDAQLREVRTEP